LKTGKNKTFQNFIIWLKLKQKISEQIGRQKAIEALRNPKGPLKSTAVPTGSPERQGQKNEPKRGYGSPNQKETPFKKPHNSNCSLSNNPHPLIFCSRFKALDLEFRFRIRHLRSNGSCFICLGGGHKSRFCPKKNTSKCTTCSLGKHHTSIHGLDEQSSETGSQGAAVGSLPDRETEFLIGGGNGPAPLDKGHS
jgi:hypothetical protein